MKLHSIHFNKKIFFYSLLLITCYCKVIENGKEVLKIECCNHYCEKRNLHPCFCKKYDLMTPEQIIDSIDNSYNRNIDCKKKCCCCKKKKNIIIIRKSDDFSLKLPKTDFNLNISSLYIPPPIKNSFDKDLFVRTEIMYPEKLFDSQQNTSQIYADEFSITNLTKTNDGILVNTTLNTTKIGEILNKTIDLDFNINKRIFKGGKMETRNRVSIN